LCTSSLLQSGDVNSFSRQSKSRTLQSNLSLKAAGEGDFCNFESKYNPINETRDVNCFQEEEEDMDVPEMAEEIIDLLLTGLRDSVCNANFPFCA
jgi:hypothetical protein